MDVSRERTLEELASRVLGPMPPRGTPVQELLGALRFSGFQIKLTHYRVIKRWDGSEELVPGWYARAQQAAATAVISPTGGMTHATLYRDGICAAFGEAVCHPADNFSRSRGALIALGRALKQMSVEDE